MEWVDFIVGDKISSRTWFYAVASTGMGHWGTCPLEFANARKFCRPNCRWLSLLDDFVSTNFGTPPDQNSGDPTCFTGNFAEKIDR